MMGRMKVPERGYVAIDPETGRPVGADLETYARLICAIRDFDPDKVFGAGKKPLSAWFGVPWTPTFFAYWQADNVLEPAKALAEWIRAEIERAKP